MHYLQNLIQLLKAFFNKIFTKGEIPLIIAPDELLVRGILHPLFFSKNKLQTNAFLPPPGEKDVSLLRHEYANSDYCKNHCKKLKVGDNKYRGMATFLSKHIKEINDRVDSINAETKATPLDKDNNYITNTRVYISTPGLPAHASIIYENIYERPVVKGEPQTAHREFANQIKGIANYFEDTDVENSKWTGQPLCWIPKA